MEDEDDLGREHIARRDALAAAGLFIEDPEADAGLAFPVPAGAKIVRLLTSYDTKLTTGRKVRCAGCPTHMKHHKGFRALLDNDLQANIGKDCGEAHSEPGAWETMNASLSRLQREAYDAARIAPTIANITAAEPMLRSWNERCSSASKFYRAFQDAFPDLAVKIATAGQQSNGRLEFQTTRRLSERERRLRNGQTREIRTHHCATVPHWRSFRHENPVKSIIAGFRQLAVAKQELASSSAPARVAEAFRMIRAANAKLSAAADEHNQMLRNFSLDWWTGVPRWAKAEKLVPGELRFDDRCLVCDDDREEVRLAIPDPRELACGWDEIKKLLAL